MVQTVPQIIYPRSAEAEAIGFFSMIKQGKYDENIKTITLPLFQFWASKLFQHAVFRKM